MTNKFVLLLLLGVTSACHATGIRSITAFETELSFDVDTEYKVGLIELQPYQDYDKSQSYATLWQGKGDKTNIKRFAGGWDRIYSKFALINMQTQEMIGDYRYVTEIHKPVNDNFKLPRPKSKKGLSCIVEIDDAIDLGVKYVVENVNFNDMVDLANPNSEERYDFAGLQIPLNMTEIEKLDSRLKRFSDAGMSVFAVFINKMPKDPSQRTPLVHPNSDMVNSPTGLGGFNVTNESGLKYYLGVLEFLSKRYTRPDKKYGLITSLIVGNEVTMHWVWHNVGDMPEDQFIKEYETALRLAWLACSKYNNDLRVYVSMDHHWAKRGFNNNPMREIPGDILLEKIAKLSKAGGDYPWNVAFHPYPENLFEPRFWFDQSVTDDFSTPKISFKNLDVLPRFIKQDNMLYNGQVRDIALTEQGFHSPDGSEGEKIQAAAYAYAYYKIAQIPEISAFVLHRHVDHRDEGGLKLGLWSNKPDGKDSNPWKKKYIWKVFKYADTNTWESAFEFSKPILGIENWGDPVPDKNPEIKSIFKVDQEKVVYDFIKEFENSKKVNNLDCRLREVYRAAGWLVPAIFQHPPQQSAGKINYEVVIPVVEEDDKVILLFETIVSNNEGDGVNYTLQVNNQNLWSHLQKGIVPKSHAVDLTKFSGEKVIISFEVDKNKDIANDWAYWVSPMLVLE